MYKTLTFVLVVLVGIASASRGLRTKSNSIKHVESHFASSRVGLDVCPTCINIAGDSINALLNIIIQGGVIGTCGTLCTELGDITKSQIIGAVCNIVCDVFGIEEFIKLIEAADLDPIWYCEIAKLCPVNDNGDAKFTKFSVLPATGRQGTTFSIDFTYVSLNGTGTGEIDVDISAPDLLPLGASFLLEAKKPGTYSERITVKAEPDPSCDPTQQECEEWLPGTYNVTVQVCNGECGSKHPHSTIYDTTKGSFQITK